jgi:hypothetical protein
MKLCIMFISKNKLALFLKIYFEKTYDKVNWDFLMSCHEDRGFNPLWCSWVRQSVHNGTMSVKINKEARPYFQSAKGVRQGDLMAPLLFNMVGVSLTKKWFYKLNKMVCLYG